jgi:hypothetical protein
MILDKQVALSRASQLLEKETQKVAAAKERQYYDILWEQDRQKKIQREEQDRLHRYELNQNMIKILGEQLAMLKAQAAEEKHLKQEEASMMVRNSFLIMHRRRHLDILKRRKKEKELRSMSNSVRPLLNWT